MLGVLNTILCWIKQFGALMLGALVGFVNLVISGVGGAAQAVVDAWPIGMPNTPTMPGELLTALGWIKWGPLPLDALLAFVLFVVTVWALIAISGPLLKWLKLID